MVFSSKVKQLSTQNTTCICCLWCWHFFICWQAQWNCWPK